MRQFEGGGIIRAKIKWVKRDERYKSFKKQNLKMAPEL